MSANINEEDRGLHGKLLIQGAVNELQRWLEATNTPSPQYAALILASHYLFEIAHERHGEGGVALLTGTQADWVHHAKHGCFPDDELPH